MNFVSVFCEAGQSDVNDLQPVRIDCRHNAGKDVQSYRTYPGLPETLVSVSWTYMKFWLLTLYGLTLKDITQW